MPPDDPDRHYLHPYLYLWGTSYSRNLSKDRNSGSGYPDAGDVPLHLYSSCRLGTDYSENDHALPGDGARTLDPFCPAIGRCSWNSCIRVGERSEEHTSELQSRGQLVCRLLL